jgi:hypothetical protein
MSDEKTIAVINQCVSALNDAKVKISEAEELCKTLVSVSKSKTFTDQYANKTLSEIYKEQERNFIISHINMVREKEGKWGLVGWRPTYNASTVQTLQRTNDAGGNMRSTGSTTYESDWTLFEVVPNNDDCPF